MLIHQGKLLTGVMDKKILGTSGGSLIHVTWLEKGSGGDDVPHQSRANAHEQLVGHGVV